MFDHDHVSPFFYSYYDSNKLIRGKNAGYFSRSVSVAVMVWLNMICTTKQSKIQWKIPQHRQYSTEWNKKVQIELLYSLVCDSLHTNNIDPDLILPHKICQSKLQVKWNEMLNFSSRIIRIPCYWSRYLQLLGGISSRSVFLNNFSSLFLTLDFNRL